MVMMTLKTVMMEVVKTMIMIEERERIVMRIRNPEETGIMRNQDGESEAEAPAVRMNQIQGGEGEADQETGDQKLPGWQKCQL